MSTKWRYPKNRKIQLQDTLAETVSHALSRIEALKGKDRICIVEEYKEWLGDDDDEIVTLKKIKNQESK